MHPVGCTPFLFLSLSGIYTQQQVSQRALVASKEALCIFREFDPLENKCRNTKRYLPYVYSLLHCSFSALQMFARTEHHNNLALGKP